ncbi:MAG: MBL fold metallo-hydrolase [Xanthomonadales bacterium]|nr:MBL fold metallo-hydrolase [Xanthomonadales bacterium]
MNFLRRAAPTALAAAALAAVAPSHALDLEVALDGIPLSERLHLLRTDSVIGNPTSVLYLGKQGSVLIDANLLEAAPLIREYVKREGGGPIRTVATTHYHTDHVHGLEAFGPDATVITPVAQAERLKHSALLEEGGPPLVAGGQPDETFERERIIELDGAQVVLRTLPRADGHTDGDLVAWFPAERVLYVGDYYFPDKWPIIDLEGGGDLQGYLANVQHLLRSYPGDMRVIAGHGTFKPEEPRAYKASEYHRWLQTLRRSVATIRGGMQQGKTREQLIAEGLPEPMQSMGEKPRFVSTEQWIGFVYDYLEANPPVQPGTSG